MKKILFIAAGILYSINLLGQQREFKEGCGFLDNPQYKNGTDTVTILARLTDLSKVHIYGDLFEIAKKRKTNIKDYNSGIVIQPVGCDKEFLVAVYVKNIGKTAISLMEPDDNAILKFRCVLFEGYFVGANPLFIVDRITKP